MTNMAAVWMADDFDEGQRRAARTREGLLQFGLRRPAWQNGASISWPQVVLRGDLEVAERLLEEYGDGLYMLRLLRSLIAEYRGDLELAEELTPSADSPTSHPVSMLGSTHTVRDSRISGVEMLRHATTCRR